MSARKPPYRAEIRAISCHSGRDFGTSPATATAPDGLRVGEGQQVSPDVVFRGQ